MPWLQHREVRTFSPPSNSYLPCLSSSPRKSTLGLGASEHGHRSGEEAPLLVKLGLDGP